MLNVAAYQNGVGYGAWKTIDGWSESVVQYIQDSERSGD
jgi:60 kDa SS-A/Ro ribonucleoprotein